MYHSSYGQWILSTLCKLAVIYIISTDYSHQFPSTVLYKITLYKILGAPMAECNLPAGRICYSVRAEWAYRSLKEWGKISNVQRRCGMD